MEYLPYIGYIASFGIGFTLGFTVKVRIDKTNASRSTRTGDETTTSRTSQTVQQQNTVKGHVAGGDININDNSRR